MTEEQKAELRRLQKLTTTKLRDEVMENHHNDIVGVSGMSKEQIIEAVCKLKGIPYDEETHKVAKGVEKTKIKKRIKGLKAKLDESGQDKNQRKVLRTKVKRLKRTLRHAV